VEDSSCADDEKEEENEEEQEDLYIVLSDYSKEGYK